MDKYRLAGVAVVAAVTTPISAYALNFDFSFTGQNGGVVTGEIFGLAASGSSKATDIVIDSVPTSLVTPAVPYDLFARFTHAPTANAFSVSSGTIVGYSFYASVVRPNYIALTLDAATLGYHNTNGQTFARGQRGGATFTPAAAVPEPASIALLGAGLAGISAFRRRRNASA